MRETPEAFDDCGLQRDRLAGGADAEALHRDRPSALRGRERQPDHLVNKGRVARIVAARRDDHRQHEAMFRRRDAPAAGEPGKVGKRAVRGRGHCVVSALRPLLEPAQAPACEHRVVAMLGHGETRDSDVARGGADVPDRDRGDAQVELEFRVREGRHRRHRLSRSRGVGRRNCEARAVAAEDERKRAPFERVGDGGDDAGADHVDGLVAPLCDGLGGPDDVGEADDPVVRQRTVVLGLHGVGEIVEDRKGGVEVDRVAGHGVSRLRGPS